MKKHLILPIVVGFLSFLSVDAFAQYCTPTVSQTWGKITKVTTTGGTVNLNKSVTGSHNYTNFSASDSVSTGTGKSFTMSVTTIRGNYDGGISVWIDWDNNKTFATNERVYYQGANGTGTKTFTVNVPAVAASGKLRMRVSVGYFSLTPVCGGSYNSSVQDYTVYVAPPSARDAELSDLAPRFMCAGLQDINVRVTNKGVDSIASIILKGSIGTTTFGPTTFSGLNIKSNKDTTLKLGTFNFVSGTTYNIEFYSYTVNGATDQKTANDTLSIIGFKNSMNGTYTIGGSSPDFATINAAKTALYANGVCGPVTFNVRSGSYTGKVVFNGAIEGISATNNVRFRPDPANSAAATLTFSSGNILEFLGGASYIAFDSLTIAATGSAYNIRFTGPSDHLSFNGNNINSTSTNYSLFYFSSTIIKPTNLTIENNNLQGGYNAIYLRNGSSSTAGLVDGLTIRDNVITGFRGYGIYLYGHKNGLIHGNTVTSLTTGTGSVHGIYAYYCDFTDFTSNKVTVYTNSSGYGRGFYLWYCDGNSTDRNLIANNMVSAPNQSSSSSYFHTIYNCYYTDVVYNSFYAKRTSTTSTYGCLRLSTSTSTTINYTTFRNNSVFNDAAGYGLRINGNPTRSHNNLKGGGTVNRNVVGATQGANGLNVDPNYVSATDLHINSTALNAKGTPFTGVTTDIDGETRNTTTPDIGADEVEFPDRDATPIEIVYAPSCPGTETIKVRVSNKGLLSMTSVKVDWTISANGGTPVSQSQVSWSGSLASGADTVLTLGNMTLAAGVSYVIKATTSLPSGLADQKTVNDTLSREIQIAMNGTYTVGGLSSDFTTPILALQSLNDLGVCGPVVFNIRPGTYADQLVMEEIDGASATNTITWNGTDVSNTTLTHLGSNPEYATIEVKGADFMIFKNLNITNSYTGSYSTAIRLHDGANNITVDSCELSGSSTGTSYGLLASTQYNSSNGAVNNNITVSNCLIKNVGEGISMRSNSTNNRSTNIRIENNTFTNIKYTGIFLYWYFDSVSVVNNDLSDFAGTSYGMYCYYIRNLTVDNNEIVATGSYGMYLYRINYTGATTSSICKVTNNMVAHTAGNVAAYLYYANYADVYHNSFRANSSYAFYDRFGTAKEIKNNIFSSETNYAYYSGSTTTSYLTSLDNNLYYRGNSTSIAYYGGARTLASWQSYRSALNANSDVGNPKFVSPSDLRIANGKPADSLGASGVGITKDIDGATRSTTHPDAGAHEYDYQPIDGHLVALTRPSGLCLSATDTVEFAVVNVGGDTIDMATNGVSIAWQVTGPNTASGTDAINVGKLAPGDTVLVKAVGSVVNLSTAGKYTISAYITSSWDRYNENDTLVEQLDRIATESIVAVRDTTVYYKDSLDVTAESALGGTVVVLSEMCQWNTTTGSPSGGRPSYLTSDDYVELSTGKGNVDLSGYILEMYSSNSATPRITATLPAGAATNSSGTLIIGGGTGTSVANAYYALGHGINNWSSSTPVGYILRNPRGKIVDAAAANSAIFNAATGVTSADWSGNVAGSGSTHGIRRNGPDNNTATGWIRTQSVTGQRQDPNTLNAGMNLKSGGPPFKWTYNGSFYDSLSTTQAGPWTAKGTKEYIASFVSPCSGDTIRDTASIVAFEKNLVTSGNSTEYYSYPLSQTSGIEYSGELNNYGDAMTSVRANVTLDGAAAGDTLVSNSMVRNASGNFTIPNTATVTTTGNKSIKYYYTATTGDDFISDDSANAIVNVSDTVMARENGVLPVSLPASGMTGLGQRFTVFNQDSVTGAQAYIKTAFAGDKFKLVLYNLNGNTVGSKINESGDITLQSMADTGWKKIRFKCLSVLDAGDYLLALELTSSVFSSEVGANHVNATPNSGFVYNGTTWNTTLVNGKQFNSGLRLEFGSYDFPTFAVIDPACISGDTFALSGGLPTGGSYFGTGVSSNSLDPTALTVGLNTVYYTVDNIYGCPDTIGSTIEVKGDPVVSSTFTQLTSCVSANAAISVSATGAFGTLSYSINNGSSFQSTGTFNSIGSGSYTIVVEDSVCSVTDTTYVAAPPGAPNKPSASGGSTYCKGDALSNLNVSTNTSGTAGTFKWFKDGSLTSNHGTGSTIAPTDTVMTQIYYVIEDRLGCVSVADTTVVTINALPNVNISSLSARCTNADSVVLTNGTPTGGSYSGTGISSGVFKPSVAGSGSHVLTYSYTDANTCTDNDTVSVTVHQAPVATYSVLDSACTNTPTYALSGGAPSGGTYSGFGVSGGNFNPGTAGLGSHAISYKVSNTNCSDSASINIRVNLAPTASLSTISDRCVDASALTLTGGTPTGGIYSGNGVSSGMFNPTVAGIGTHAIKYVYTDSKACMDSASTNVFVDSLPAVSFASLNALCGNSSQITLSQGNASPTGGTGTYFGTGVSGSSFNPSSSGAGSFSLGYAYLDIKGCRDTAYSTQVVDTVPIVTWNSTLSDVCIDAASFALSGAIPMGGLYKGPSVRTGIFSADTAGAGSHTLEYVFIDGNNCKDSVTNTIWVDTLPAVAITLPNNWCLNAEPFLLTSGMPSGGNYAINNTADTVFKSSVSGVDTVTYMYTDTNNCTNTAMATIIVDTVPVVTFANLADACVGDGVIQLKQGAPAGGFYSGMRTSSIGFYAPVMVGTDTLNYNFTDNNGCTDSASQMITVNALPIVSLAAFSSICQNTGVFTLNNGTPAGGVYAGKGVNGAVFDPMLRTVGVDTVTYTYTDANNCVNKDSKALEIHEAPVASMRSIGDACDNGDTIRLNLGMPTGGTYSGAGVNNGVIVPDTSLIGTNMISYIVTNSNCSDTAIGSYKISPTPVFDMIGKLEGCKNDTLRIATNAKPGFVHKWSNGAAGSSIEVTRSGMLWVKVIDPSTALRCFSKDTVDVKLEGECVGIDPTLSVNDIRYYPNPNNGNFNYEISGLNGNSAQLRIFSSNGQEVYFTEFTNMAEKETGEIMLDNMEQGVYYIQLNSSIGSAVHRIVINR
ncbi:MAG: hypothetical protein CL842_06610 [Crocinitomicaceae bacterium]|nr:hypothetical protein [Crocinitomicaceae bacterium]|tara:strand:+ start:67454 stop:76375 length:8922 start_codon:yes stop_codon:yes gene_type:complete